MQVFAGDHVEHARTRLPAKILEVHVDTGERRPRGGRHDLPVVETDDRDSLGHDDTAFTKGVGGASRDLVVAAKQGVGRRTLARKELCDCLTTPALRPDSRKVEPIDLFQARRGQGPAVADPAQAHGFEPLGPGDVCNAPAAEF